MVNGALWRVRVRRPPGARRRTAVREEPNLLQALTLVTAMLLLFAGGVIAAVARSQANRKDPTWMPWGDIGLPPLQWPWLLSYVFLALGFLLFTIA